MSLYIPFERSAMSWAELYFYQLFCTGEWILDMCKFDIHEFCLARPKYASSYPET